MYKSDIAVFNMLGYKFQHADYVGRGVIEAIGIGIDFKDGDLALRGNFATLDDNDVIIDRIQIQAIIYNAFCE